LESGAHAITANKGALVYGYHELNELPDLRAGVFCLNQLYSTVPQCFRFFEQHFLPSSFAVFSGVFSSTTNVIIETMEAGRSFAEGLKTAQELGVTETDPSHDIDGWDSTVKVCALASVLMNLPLKPDEVNREGFAISVQESPGGACGRQAVQADSAGEASRRRQTYSDGATGADCSQRSAGQRARDFTGDSFRIGHDARLNNHFTSTQPPEHRLWFVGRLYQRSTKINLQNGQAVRVQASACVALQQQPEG